MSGLERVIRLRRLAKRVVWCTPFRWPIDLRSAGRSGRIAHVPGQFAGDLPVGSDGSTSSRQLPDPSLSRSSPPSRPSFARRLSTINGFGSRSRGAHRRRSMQRSWLRQNKARLAMRLAIVIQFEIQAVIQCLGGKGSALSWRRWGEIA